MNYSTPTLTRRDWCALVATLCAPGMEANATQSLWNMLPAFRHFPDFLFTPDTARDVALAPRRLAIPAFDEISKALNDYRRTYIHEPRPALPAPEPVQPETGPRLTPEQREAVLRDFAVKNVLAARERRMGTPFGERPLRDVTMKGDVLRKSRAARGCNVPVTP